MISSILVICLSLTFGFLFMFLFLTVMRSHRLVVRSPDSNRIIGYYFINPKVDKETGVTWWQSVFFQRKIKLPAPPDECIYINPRGKSWVEVYSLSDSEYVYIKDKGLDKNSMLEKDKKKLSDSFKPFTAVQRQVIVNQFAKAEALKQKNWLKENAMNLISLSVLALVIVMFIVYWGDFSQFALQKDAASTSLLKEAKGLIQDAAGIKDVAAATVSEGTVVVEGSESPPRE